MKAQELIDRVNATGEQRNFEIKQSMSWNEPMTKAKVTKTILGMSNIRDGGMIVLGFKSRNDGTFESDGITKNDMSTFDYDDMSDFVAKYADPFVVFTLERVANEGNSFLIIKIKEFESVPVICKKNLQIAKQNELEEGAIYSRTRRKPETSKVMTASDLREILDLASDKEARRLFSTASEIGLALKETPSDAQLFAKEIEGLP